MSKVGIVFWSGSGNTEKMANLIADGAKAAGAEVTLMGPSEFNADRFSEFSAVAFGCPAMGSEQLEEDEYEPMFTGIEGSLGGKKIALFGSYGWGDGQWMRDWFERCVNAGAAMEQDEGLICNESPNAEAQEACTELGKDLAKA